MADDAHFRLRLPVDLKAEIEASAVANNRSLNAEVVARLMIARTTPDLEARVQSLEATIVGLSNEMFDHTVAVAVATERLQALDRAFGDVWRRVMVQPGDKPEPIALNVIG